jgi:hypothetical protein
MALIESVLRVGETFALAMDDGYRAGSGPSSGDDYRSGIRPIEAFMAAIRKGCFTS